MWNGTTATLNPNPAMRKTRAMIRGGSIAGWTVRSRWVLNDAGTHRADDEELDRRLRRLLVPLAVRHEREGAQARRLERQEEHEQVRRGGGEHHADDREEHE